jgi:hypothetical protein
LTARSLVPRRSLRAAVTLHTHTRALTCTHSQTHTHLRTRTHTPSLFPYRSTSVQYTVEHVQEMVKRNQAGGNPSSSMALAKLKLERAIAAAEQKLTREEAILAAAQAEVRSTHLQCTST